jgi:hypothetical protein
METKLLRLLGAVALIGTPLTMLYAAGMHDGALFFGALVGGSLVGGLVAARLAGDLTMEAVFHGRA